MQQEQVYLYWVEYHEAFKTLEVYHWLYRDYLDKWISYVNAYMDVYKAVWSTILKTPEFFSVK